MSNTAWGEEETHTHTAVMKGPLHDQAWYQLACNFTTPKISTTAMNLSNIIPLC